MPSDFHHRQPQKRRKTLSDLIGQLETQPRGSRPTFSTTPLAGPGRVRTNADVTRSNRESALERRQRVAREALQQLKGR